MGTIGKVSKALQLLDEKSLPPGWTQKVYSSLECCEVCSVISLILFERICKNQHLIAIPLLKDKNCVTLMWIACLSLALKFTEDSGIWLRDVCLAVLDGDCETESELNIHFENLISKSKIFEMETFRILNYDVGVRKDVFDKYVFELNKLS